ncbi:MAG: T9SS type A sorting domain-containing protein [bacterium]|nr:T9SS type A sorting domain-containing protein [bacterium]
MGGLGALLLMAGLLVCNSALQAADRQVDVFTQFQQQDSAFRTVFDPFESPGKGKGWKPYNRWAWFYGQRLTPDQTSDPVALRMQAWQEKQANRERVGALDENWTSIGPSNFAGRILDIAWHPTNTNIIYVGSASGGLWKTTDGGATWAPLTDDLPSLAIGSVELDPANPNIIYIGTGEGSFNVDAVFGAGVFKSTDGGATWSTTGLSWTQSQNRAVNKIIVDPTNSQIVYAACNSSVGGIYKSTNGGSTWTLYHTGDVKDLEMHPDSASVLYCANGYPWGTTNNGIYKSTNGGVTWTQLTSGLPSGSNHGRVDLAISPSSPSTVYAGISQTISNGAGLYGIYKTTNSGGTWTVQATTPNMYSGQGWYNLVIAVHPTDPNQVWSSGLDAYKSTNGGVAWTRMTFWSYSEGNAQYAHADHHALAYMPGNPNTLIVGTDGGLFKSTNGGTSWVGLNNGLVTYQYYAICNDNLQADVAYGGTQDNGTNKYNNSNTHTRPLGGDGGYCNVDFTNSSNVYGTTQRGNHYKSTNGGSSFTSIQNGISGQGAWVTPRVMDPTNANILYTGTNLVYKTTNGGASWTAISTALDASTISHLAVAPSNPQTIYVAYEGYDGKIFKTNDGGTNWVNIETGVPERYPTHVVVDPANHNVVYVTVSGYGSGHVYKSTNGGTSWSNSSTGLPDIPVNCMVIDQSNGNKMYVGTDLGVYYSDDAGASWSDFSVGLPNVVVDFLALHPSTGVLRAGTHGRGLWQTETSAPELVVQTPNGGESWSMGVSNTITWGTGSVGGNVAIEINRTYPSGTWDTIQSSTANDGSHSWLAIGPATTTARIRVRHLTVPEAADTSNANFSIVAPSITVLSPNGGEDWTVGTQHTIRWTKTGNISNVEVYVKRDWPNGAYNFITLTSDTFYNWTVAAPTDPSCRIVIVQNGNQSLGDTSNANFAISGPWLEVDLPNGNEILTPGQAYTVRWSKHNFNGPCRVELNRTYPSATWITLSSSVAADSLVWNVDQNGSATARMRVTSLDYATASDTSDSNFGINPPFLQVTAPNTAVSWLTGSTQSITWSHSSIVGPFNIYVNRAYPTGEWELLAVNVTGTSWSWVVNGPTSTTARVRVAPVNIPGYQDDSNVNFTIANGSPGITVVAPNGAENWAIGTSQTITWSRNLADGAVTVALNRNYPGGTWETLSASNTGTSQGWTVTGPASTNARIRVTLNSDGNITDVSNSPFNIVQPTLTLGVPNGGEAYNVGATVPISFTRVYVAGNVTAQLMRDYPNGTWETLSTTIISSSYNWTATGPGTTNARVRVYLNSDPALGDTSNANFTINQPGLTLASPNGGEAWNVGTTQTIRWSRMSASGGVRVMLNRGYPTGAWEQLASSVTVDTLSWVVNSPVTNAARVRIYLVSNSSLADTSAADFAILNPGLVLTAPNGGESWLLNTPHTIRWTRNNAPGNVTVQFNRSYPGGAWEQLANNVAVDTFNWTPTGAASSSVRTRIFLTTQSAVGDTSNANFALTAPTLAVTSPNGGEQWVLGSQQIVRFTRSNASGNATIQVNRSNGSGAWETLTTLCAVDTFAWTVSGSASTTALVRVRLTADSTITDNSNAVFSIVQPYLTVTAPNGGEQITLGGNTTIRFARFFASGAATISLNRSYPGGSWEVLTNSCAADTFVWLASGAASTTARVKVELTTGGATADESNANFSLVQRTLALTSHNSGTYYVGTTSPITWTRSNADGAVNVQLNRSYPGANWETLATGVTTNSYNWTVNTPVSSAARVRVVHQTYGWVGDSSDANIAIENATLALLAPSGSPIWAVGSQQNIAWTKSGTTSSVRVDFNRTYPGGAWETLSAAETDTLYTWTVTGPASTTARVRVVATANESLADTSDAVTIAQPTLTWTAPADNSTLQIGFPLTLRWARYLASGAATVTLNRNYPNGAWETIGSTAGDTLAWTISGPVSSNARFRIYLNSNALIADTTGNMNIVQPSLAVTAPNGGEQIRTTTSTTVTWTRSNLSGAVRVDLNTNYPGGAWTTLASGLTGNSYTWNVTQEPTTVARVRVIFEQIPTFGDTSNANFTIFRPDLSLTAPSGGETWVTGTTYPITFTRTDHAQAVTVKLNRTYPSGAWETIATNVTGNSVNWIAAGAVTTTARLKLESSVYANVGDTMAANFSILTPGVTLLYPDGGETWGIGRSVTMRFQRVQVSGVDVHLNRSYPAGAWELLASNVQADSLVWTVSGATSTACRVRVQNTSNTAQNDVSSSNFAIQQPALAFSAPVPGDTLAIGLPNLIAFTRNAAASGNVRVDVNTNYPGGAWQQIGLTVANDLYWTPAGPPTLNTRLRLVHTEIANLGDTLDFNVPIDFASLTVTSPTASGSYEVGDTMPITWTRSRVGTGANVYLNRTYPGGIWELVAGGVQTDSYNWTVSGPRSTSAVLRVLSTRNAALGDSTLVQTILVPSITLTAPNSGVLGIGNTETISFSKTDFTSSVAIDINYSYPNGAWQTIATGVTGASYNWIVSGNETGMARLRVRSEEFGVLDLSDNNLTLVTPSIYVSTLNTAELFEVGDPVQITWTKNGVPGGVNVEFNRDYPGGVWESLATNVTQNMHTWTVNNPGFAHGRVRVSMYGRADVNDVNDADFGTFLPALQLTAPNGGDTLIIGRSYTMRWARNGASGSVRVQLNRTWPDGTWETLLTQTSADSFVWTAAGASSLQARVRVQMVFDNNVYDLSDENFAILPESVVLLTPSSGDSIAIGDTVRFSWRRIGLNPGVTVYLKRNYPSGQWTILANAVQADSFLWVATGDPAPNAHFRILSSWNSSLGDTVGACPLGTPVLTITDPAVPEMMIVGDTQTITWSRSFAAGAANVEVSRNGVLGPWTAVGQTNGSTFNWVVTEPLTASARFRVSLVNKPWVQGAVTFNSSIVLARLDLVEPQAGDTLAVGREITVAWSRENTEDPIDVLLNRGNPVSDIEILREDVTGDSIHWTVTPPLTPNSRFILRTASGVFVETDGDTCFVVAQPLVTVTQPNGGESWVVGQPITVTWSRAAASDPVSVQLNRNYPNGAWETLAQNVSGSSYVWTVNGAATTNARVRVISDEHAELFDVSDGTHAIILPTLGFAGALPARVPLGFAQSVNWQVSNLSGTVSLYLSRDNGATFNELLAANLATTSYSWTPAGSAAPQAMLKIQSDAQPQVYALSNAFVLATPTLTVSSPQNGEMLTIEQPVTLRWTRADHPAPVRVEIDRNYPSSWETLVASVNADSLVWTVSGAPTTQARLRVASTVNSAWNDLGDGNFTLLQAQVVLIAPVDNAPLVLGNVLTTRWERVGFNGAVSVRLNRVGGSSTVIAAATLLDSVAWTVSGDAAAQAYLVINSLAAPFCADSIPVFGPYQPSLALTTPSGDSRWVINSPQTVRWTRSHVGGNVRVLLNSGAGFVEIGQSADDSLVSLPTSAANNALVAIQAVMRGDLTDTSASFRVVAPSLTMNSVGDPDFRVGIPRDVTWDAHEIIGDAILEFSRDGANGPWEQLYRGTAEAYEWSPSLPETENGRLRVRSELEAQFSDVLNQAIGVYQPTLAITMTTPAETLYVGMQVELQITGDHIAEHVSETVIVALDRDGQVESLADITVPGTLIVTIEEPLSSVARFRAFVAGDQELQAATPAFVLSAPALAWTNEPPADVLANETVALSWNAAGVQSAMEVVRLDASGETTLAENLLNVSWNWTVEPPRGDARLIVRTMDDHTIADTTATFRVHVPELQWLAPNTSGSDTAGQTIELAWSALDGAAPVNLEVTFNGADWMIAATGVTDTTYSYALPYHESEALQFRVTSVSYPQLSALSPVRTLVARALTIDAGDETVWYVGEERWIRWSRAHAPGDVELAVNYGDRAEGNWQNVATTELDSFLWTVEGPESEFAALRIRLAGESAVFDTTDLPISIRMPSITVIEPNSGGGYDVTQQLRIRWDSEGISGNVHVALWRGAPIHDLDTLFLSTENDGEEIWTITGPNADSCFVIIASESDTSIHDLSDAPFRIQGGTPIDPSGVLLPNVVALGAPYPNPFNATLTVPFELPQPADVRIVVFDVLGREVEELFDGKQPAGFLRATWQAHAHASGLYFVRMQSADFTDVKRVHLIK